MGKKQHQGDKLYLTTKEWKYLYGGHKDDPISTATRAKFRRLPFDHCCLSLLPFENPLCDESGNIFDLMTIVPYLKKCSRNPVTGKKLDAKSLTHLNVRKNNDGQYHCPVTYKLFSNNTHIVAIKPTGNVFSYDAVEQLNFKTKNFTDLINDVSFTRSDVITLQDPTNLDKFNIADFYHVKHNMKVLEDQKGPVETLRHKNQETKETLEQLSRDYKPAVDAQQPSTSGDLDTVNSAHFSIGMVAAGLTSTVMEPETTHVAARINNEYLRYERVKKKGYVRLVTNFGPLNLELHCDQVPKTCENFIKLCDKNYYNGTIFHRSIKHFMIQGGDPEGTGNGGDSYWGGTFKDEFKSNMTHSGRGVLSMANSGPNTNKSQFFITFRSCNHLDKKHTVFGKVVGGIETLNAMERIETDEKDTPVEKIKILSTEVFVDPYCEADQQLAKDHEDAKKKIVDEALEEERLKDRALGKHKLNEDGPVAVRAGIGKYIPAKRPPTTTTAVDAHGGQLRLESGDGGSKRNAEPPIVLKKKKKVKSGLSDFSAW